MKSDGLAGLGGSFTIDVVAKALDGLSARHKAIASNLANVDTPGYCTRSVSFEGALKQAIDFHNERDKPVPTNSTELEMNASLPGHFSNVDRPASLDKISPQVHVQDSDWKYRNDKNQVDIEAEMVRLAETTQRFIALSNIEGRKINGLKTIIHDAGMV